MNRKSTRLQIESDLSKHCNANGKALNPFDLASYRGILETVASPDSAGVIHYNGMDLSAYVEHKAIEGSVTWQSFEQQ